MSFRAVRRSVVLGVALGIAAWSGDASAKSAKREQVRVAGVITAEDQYVVVLRTQKRPFRYLPIWIGESEAMAIQLRLDNNTPPRPLTLNLLESILKASKIKVVRIDCLLPE